MARGQGRAVVHFDPDAPNSRRFLDSPDTEPRYRRRPFVVLVRIHDDVAYAADVIDLSLGERDLRCQSTRLIGPSPGRITRLVGRSSAPVPSLGTQKTVLPWRRRSRTIAMGGSGVPPLSTSAMLPVGSHDGLV
jgi:hypothetical protein